MQSLRLSAAVASSVVEEIRRRCDERLGVDPPAHAAVKYHHSELDCDGYQHYHDGYDGEIHRLWGDYPLDSAAEQFYPDDDDKYRYDESGDVFIPRVTVWVLRVRALFRQLESYKAYQA